MRPDETVKVARHIALAFCESVIPALPLLLEQLEQAVFFVNHRRPHHPRLKKREEIHAEMRFKIRLDRVLDRDMHPPLAGTERFRRRTRLRTEMLGMRDHRLRADEIGSPDASPNAARGAAL